MASPYPGLDHGYIIPSKPQTSLANHKLFDYNTPRICFYPSIDKALSGLGQNLENLVMYIYSPVYMTKDSTYKPDITESPTSKLTGETWILEKIRVTLEKKIKIGKPYKELSYTYGERGTKKHLTEWTWTDLSIPKKKTKGIYFVSDKLQSDLVLQQRVPENYMTEHGYEDSEKKRICFSTSIDGCLTALGRNLEKDKVLYVYKPDEKIAVYKPSKKEVPDVDITDEVWSDEIEIHVHPVFKLSEFKAIGKGLPYTYGPGKKALEYRWTYKKEQI